MIYFKTREIARVFAKKNSKYRVVDCSDNPSLGNGWRWAVKVL